MWIVLTFDHRADVDVSLHSTQESALATAEQNALNLARDPKDVKRKFYKGYGVVYETGGDDHVDVMEREVDG